MIYTFQIALVCAVAASAIVIAALLPTGNGSRNRPKSDPVGREFQEEK
jgi:hypothetical protein